MYRNVLVFLIMAITSLPLFSQTKKNNGKIAPFEITLADGSSFKASQLKKGPVMLIYFSPECDHCRHFTKEMLEKYKGFAGEQIVMVTFLPVDEVKHFSEEFELPSYHNIKAGTEGKTFVVRNYYNVTRFPFVALYNKEGKQVKLFSNSPSVDDVLKAIKKQG